MDARVTVFDTKFYEGFNGVEDELLRIPYGTIDSLESILTRQWPSDAHMALYELPGEELCPRLNKPSLTFFQTQYRIQAPQLSVMAIDVDIPGHGEVYNWYNREAWPVPLVQWAEQVSRAMANIPELATAGLYLTHGGMRFVWPLAPHRRIGVALADSYLRQFVGYLQQSGLPADSSCTQWNRLFRLPFVVRDGALQNLQSNFTGMRELDWAPPEPLTDEGPSAVGSVLRDVLPDGEVQPPARAELTRLRDKSYYLALTTGAPLAQPGTGVMHDTMMKTAASIVAEHDTNDPLIPYRFLLASARAAAYPENELWAQCVWCCRVHDGSKQLAQRFFVDARHEAAVAMGCVDSRVRQHLILATRSQPSYYVFNEEKQTWDPPIGSTTLLANKLSSGCPTLYQMPAATPANIVLEQHGTVVDHVVMSYVRRKVEYDPMLSAVFEPAGRVDPRLRPMYNSDIDGWLRLLFATELDRCLDWLATLTQLDRPTCALYVKAEPDVGKGLLAIGLARIWGSAPSKYEELIRNFQDGLAQCPFILADEKVPEDPFSNDDSAVFRRIIGTGRQKIFIKHRAPVELEGFPRLLITANNADALNMRDALEPADVLALQQRIGYVETGHEPGNYLKGLAHSRGMPVQDMVEPWISEGLIANHVLWLRDNRQVVRGDRFLVEGWPSALTSRMAIKFGIAPLLGRFVVKVIRDRQANIRGVLWGDGQILVNVDYVRDSWRHVMGQTSRPPGDQTLMKALKVLSDGERIAVAGRDNEGTRYFWRVDPERVYQIAEEFHLTDRETIEAAVNTPTDVTKLDTDLVINNVLPFFGVPGVK